MWLNVMNKRIYLAIYKTKNIYLPILFSMCIVQVSYADSSKINITGTVTEGGCVVSSESKEFTVDLLTHATKDINSVGSSTPSVPFSILLSSCSDSISSVRVQFTGVADNTNNSLLSINNGSSNASGVAIELLDHAMVSIPINSYSTWLDIAPKQPNSLEFRARISRTQLSVVPGSVTSTATFVLEYQ